MPFPKAGFWRWGALGALCLGLNGCFVKDIAVNSVADSLAGQGDTFASDNDPELVREAVPFSLKFMESVLSATPRHVGLLTALCKNFTEYGYAYVQSDVEVVEDEDYPKARELKNRAKKIYLRARDYGLRGLEVRRNGFGQMFKKDPKAAAALLTKQDIETFYWTGLSWMAAISLDKNDLELVADRPKAEALIYRAYELDPDYQEGSIHDFLITYEASRPGGSLKKAKEHFQRALELNHGSNASTYVNYAVNVDEAERNREEFEEMLNKALTIDVDKKPSGRLENLIMQKRAKWLLSHMDKMDVIFSK